MGRYNAQDYLFAASYPVPAKNQVCRIVDFGAEYGRQANLWSQKCHDLVYLGVDAIPKNYCLQNLYYRQLGVTFQDYVTQSSFAVSSTPGIYHMPTWRLDLLPDKFFDMIVCVQVLQEINARLVKFAIEHFWRVLKPGGCLLIRDHDMAWRPAHQTNLNDLLLRWGFELEFRPHVVDKMDIHGVPRIWRRIDPQVVAARRGIHESRVKQFIVGNDARFGGRIKKIWRVLRRFWRK